MLIRSLNDGSVNYGPNPNYQAILNLHVKLLENIVPHEILRLMDGWKIAYPNQEECIFDVVEHFGSHGHERDLMEAYGNGFIDVIDDLTVDEAYELFRKVHEKFERRKEAANESNDEN